MFGAIIGDIVGSVYEFNNIKTKDFPLWSEKSTFTDDTVMTCAVHVALREYKRDKSKDIHTLLVSCMKDLGRAFPDCGYGSRFSQWLFSEDVKPYNSYGNGSAMRVSPAAWLADSLSEAKVLATHSAEVTHNHPEGIKGAVAVAEAIYMAKEGCTKDQIKRHVSQYYELDFALDDIRDSYEFDETCQGSVPQAITAFLEARDFEDAIRGAISIGGDSDTIAAIAGSIAEPFFTIPARMTARALNILDPMLKQALGIME